MTSPMIGSAIPAPSATTAALASTPRLTKPSTRAWFPSATSAGLLRRLPARERIWAAISFPTNPMTPAAASHHRWVSVCGWMKRRIVWTSATTALTKIRQDHGDPRPTFAARAAEEERKTKRDRRQGIAKVVDEVGQ